MECCIRGAKACNRIKCFLQIEIETERHDANRKKITIYLLQRNYWSQKENELVAFLQLQLAEAINLQDRALIAHLHETLRCVRLFNDEGCRKLFKSLREDYQKRSPYIAYLIRCRQGLLSTLAHLDRYSYRPF